MNRKPTILYYDHGQEEKRKLLEKGVSRMGFSLIPVLPIQFPQTVGYLAKVKGFPPERFLRWKSLLQSLRRLWFYATFRKKIWTCSLLP